MKILLMFLVAINLFANDFRLNNWGDLSEEVAGSNIDIDNAF